MMKKLRTLEGPGDISLRKRRQKRHGSSLYKHPYQKRILTYALSSQKAEEEPSGIHCRKEPEISSKEDFLNTGIA